ncbi:MAG: argininosuccinate lyase [Rhodobacteraceae bacterium]|nr:argininosuccinate lyase [Paracoccaceae bacterium]
MKPLFAIALIASLAACGADGAPEAPSSMNATETGITLSGCAKAGVSFGAATAGGPVRC